MNKSDTPQKSAVFEAFSAAGAEFSVSNLVLMDAEAGMRVRGNLACQIRDIPDGTTIRFTIE